MEHQHGNLNMTKKWIYQTASTGNGRGIGQAFTDQETAQEQQPPGHQGVRRQRQGGRRTRRGLGLRLERRRPRGGEAEQEVALQRERGLQSQEKVVGWQHCDILCVEHSFDCSYLNCHCSGGRKTTSVSSPASARSKRYSSGDLNASHRFETHRGAHRIIN